MAIQPTEGSTPAASPSAALTLARVSLATNPFAAFREAHRIARGLPECVRAQRLFGCGDWPREDSAKPWDKAMRQAMDAETLALGDALTLAADAKRLMLEEAAAKDGEEARERMLALSREGEHTAATLADIASVEAGTYDPRGWSRADTVQGGWATLYTVELCEGGPEEGGWWYEWRDGVATVSVDAIGGAEAAIAHLTALAEAAGLSLAGDGKRGYRSAAPDVNAEISVHERTPFAGVSTRRPRYE